MNTKMLRQMRGLCYNPKQISRQLNVHAFPPVPGDLETLCVNGRLREALTKMAMLGSQVSFESYKLLLDECARRRAIEEGRRVHTHLIKTQNHWPVYLGNRLVVLYSKCGCLGDAQKVLDEMPQRNVVSWTAMMSAYSQRGYSSESLNLFVELLRSGTRPNEFTFATVLASCMGASHLLLGSQIHTIIIKSSYDSNIFVGSSLLDMYAKSGKIHEARGVFECLPERDVVTCTAIISGYAQLGFDEEAVKLFRRLQNEGMESNYVTYSSVLNALAGLAALDHGKQVHNHIIRSGLPSNVVLQNSLIDMYSKCGSLVYARQVFYSMSERSVVTWNAMLMGYSKHGMAGEVVELFESMRKENKVKPNNITFLAVLSGCSHGGMEDVGLGIFNEMVKGGNGVEPEMEHYGCVVDLLGRADRVEEAFEFITKMPFEPTASILGSLLGSCRVHSNIEIGSIVGQRLIQVDPENAGNYVILSNLYASAGRWEDAKKLRDLMKVNAVRKEPGRSWNQTGLHTFHVCDQSHPKKEEVFTRVKDMSIKFKETGYAPDLSCDVE